MAGKIGDVIYAYNSAREFFPAKMRSLESDVLTMATCIQESGLDERIQRGNGPARGLPQFEKIGIKEVMLNEKTKDYAQLACKRFGVAFDLDRIHQSFANPAFDALSFIFARLNYWRVARPLPLLGNCNSAWLMYKSTWRPGAPREDDWPESYWRAYSYFLDR